MGNGSKISSDPVVMKGFTDTLQSIDELLESACTDASTLSSKFEEAYEGEAFEEVSLFFTNLPTHLERLQILYQKLEEYITMTSASFSNNDTVMAEKMEGTE